MPDCMDGNILCVEDACGWRSLHLEIEEGKWRDVRWKAKRLVSESVLV